MPVSQITVARRLIESESHLTTAEQIERWKGRRDSARDWLTVCETELKALMALPLEMDGVVEVSAPSSASALPGGA